MTLTILEDAVIVYSQTGYIQPRPWEVSGSTPFVTGNIVLDHFLNHMLVDYGISVKLKDGPIFHQIEEVTVVNEPKASLFILKWA